MITATFPCQSQQYTLFCGLGSNVGVEIAEETSRRGELSCAGMTLAVFQHGRVKNSKRFVSRKPQKEDGGHVLSARRVVLLSAGV